SESGKKGASALESRAIREKPAQVVGDAASHEAKRAFLPGLLEEKRDHAHERPTAIAHADHPRTPAAKVPAPRGDPGWRLKRRSRGGPREEAPPFVAKGLDPVRALDRFDRDLIGRFVVRRLSRHR